MTLFGKTVPQLYQNSTLLVCQDDIIHDVIISGVAIMASQIVYSDAHFSCIFLPADWFSKHFLCKL